MSQVLTFNGVNLEIIDRNGQPWIRVSQIATALYSKGGGQSGTPFAETNIRKLYARHADEFTDAMTAVVTLPTEGGPQEARIFSLRGCHLLAMFARTSVAKEFRRWVLDVLDRLTEEENPQPITGCQQLPVDAPLTPDQQCTLQALVKAKVEGLPAEQRKGRGLYPQIWSRFNNHFRLSSYKQLPQCRMSEAVTYLTQMDICQKALPQGGKSQQFQEDLKALAADMRNLMQRMHSLRNAAKWEMMPGSYSVDDPAARERAELQDVLYRMVDANLVAAYCAADAGTRIYPAR